MNPFPWRLLACLAGALIVAGCAGRTVVESDLGIEGAPDWVNEGTNVLDDDGGRLFHGVGSASTMGDDALQTATADDRARAEVARMLTSYIDLVSADYSAAAGAGEEALTEQAVTRELKSVTRVNLAGARIIGRWRDPDSEAIYSLAELDLERVKQTVAAAEAMNAAVREHVRDRADNIFERFAREAP
jgi:hypothetical protein